MSNRAKAKKEKRRASAMEWVKEQQSRASGSTAVRVSGDIKFHKLEEGSNKFDVIPFLAGFGNKGADEGVPYWGRRYAIHRIPGIDGTVGRHCCLYETWGKPCCVCRRRNDKDIDEEVRKSLFAQVRHLMLINDKPGDTRNPAKLLDVAHFNRKLGFGEQLVTAMTKTFGPDAPHEGEDFDDPESGMTLDVECADAKYGSVSRIDFLKRKHKYPTDIAEQMPCVDDFLQPVRPADLKDKPLTDFDADDWEACDRELEKLLNGDVDGESHSASSNGKHVASDTKERSSGRSRARDDEDAPPAKKKSHSFQAGDQVEYDGETHTIKKVRDDGTLVLENEDGDRSVGIDADEVSAIAPKKGDKGASSASKSDKGDKGKSKPKPSADEDEDEPEDPSDLDDEGDEGDSDLEDDDDEDGDSDLEPDEDEDADDDPPAKAKGSNTKGNTGKK